MINNVYVIHVSSICSIPDLLNLGSECKVLLSSVLFPRSKLLFISGFLAAVVCLRLVIAFCGERKSLVSRLSCTLYLPKFYDGLLAFFDSLAKYTSESSLKSYCLKAYSATYSSANKSG